MNIEQISSWLAPFVSPDAASADQLARFSTHIELLLKWNVKINLTAIRSPQEIVQRHFGESLFAARQIAKALPISASAIDVGSGAGFPGIPLKIWLPQISLTLFESNQKKATFLREVVRGLDLADVNVLAGRAEEFSCQAELVTLRAVEKFNLVAPAAAAMVKPGGRLALLIGIEQTETTKRLLPGYRWDEPSPIPLSQKRVVFIGQSQ